MTTEWIVIANAASARIFQRDGVNAPLTPIMVLAHARSRLPGRGLVRDRPGSQAADHGRSLNTFQGRTDVRSKERARFAREIAERLEQGLNADAYSALTLVAAAPFMGELRAELSDAVAKRLCATLSIDLSHVGLAELERRMSGARSVQPL
ncbi:MAG: host attachment protein [Variovorax paradoxus]|jgi:protein required for attachment to host cells|nr:MAG: host attachment protein [Variovorax paradoxus]PZQ04464.1 MAG: host attachment protein [Variovorax paradoxus]